MCVISSVFLIALFIFLHRDLIRQPSFFPNLFIALRIHLNILVTVTYRKRSFSHLKVVKAYLRSSIQQEHLEIVSSTLKKPSKNYSFLF